MEGNICDELSLYRGSDFAVNNKITIHQPTLGEICDYGEKEYFSMVYSLTSVGADLKWQLDDLGIDYTKIDDFKLFYSLLARTYPQEKTGILLGSLDLKKFQLYIKNSSDEPVMYDAEHDILIDEYTYLTIAEVLRRIHGLKKNSQLPGNEATKRILIEDDREAYLIHKGKSTSSPLKSLISAMINSEGFKYNHSEVWDMKINAFMDSVRRITKIKNAELLLQSGYSGYGINLKEINQKEIDWLGALE